MILRRANSPWPKVNDAEMLSRNTLRSFRATLAAIRPSFLDGEVDQKCLIESMKIARSIVSQPAMPHLIDHEMSPGIKVTSDADWLEFARQNGQTIYHPMGTCRMGQDNGAVVDLSLKVRGLAGLRVIDASVMPKMVAGNIQAAVMKVAEKRSGFRSC